MFLSLVLQDYRIPVCAQLLVIAGRLSLLGSVFKPVSWLARDSRLRQTFSLRIDLVEQQSLSSICPSTIITYLWSLEASFSSSPSRSIAGHSVFTLDRNKPVIFFCLPQVKALCSQDWELPSMIDHPSSIWITTLKAGAAGKRTPGSNTILTIAERRSRSVTRSGWAYHLPSAEPTDDPPEPTTQQPTPRPTPDSADTPARTSPCSQEI